MKAKSAEKLLGIAGSNKNSVDKAADLLSSFIPTKVIPIESVVPCVNSSIGAVVYVLKNLSVDYNYDIGCIQRQFFKSPIYIFTEHISIPLLHDALRLGVKDLFVMPCKESELIHYVLKIVGTSGICSFDKDLGLRDEIATCGDLVSRPLGEVLRLLELKFDEALSLQEISRILHRSPSRVSHMFKDICGIGFGQYLLCRRLEESEYMLTQNYRSITNIAFHLGFSNPSHFCRSFKEHLGLTPSAYAKSPRKVRLSSLYKRYQKLRMEFLPIVEESENKLLTIAS